MVEVTGIQATALDGGGTASTSRLLQLGVIWQVELWHGGILVLCMLGHRALAERAAEIGIPFLLSFSRMAQVLGWEPRYDLFLSSVSISVCDFFLSLPPFFAESF